MNEFILVKAQNHMSQHQKQRSMCYAVLNLILEVVQLQHQDLKDQAPDSSSKRMFGQIKKKEKKRLFRSLIFPLFLCLQSYPNSLSNFPSLFCSMLLLQVPVRAKSTIYKLKCSSEQCRKDSLQEEAKRKGSLLSLSDLATTVTCSNSKSQMKVRNFKPAMFVLMRKQNTPTPARCSSLPSSPHLIKGHPKEGSRFKVPVQKSQINP